VYTCIPDVLCANVACIVFLMGQTSQLIVPLLTASAACLLKETIVRNGVQSYALCDFSSFLLMRVQLSIITLCFVLVGHSHFLNAYEKEKSAK